MRFLKKLTYAQQWWLAFGIALCGFVLANFLKQSYIANIGWVLVGSLYIIHPVCPEMAKWRYQNNEAKLKRDSYIAGGVVILFGLITKFGI